MQLEETLKENSRLIIDLETSQNSLETLTKEHLKGKEAEAKVEELAELILSRDESIEKLTLEIKRHSEDSEASRNAAMEKNSQLKEEIDILKQDILDKVSRTTQSIYLKLIEIYRKTIKAYIIFNLNILASNFYIMFHLAFRKTRLKA